MRLIDADKVNETIDRFIGYLDEDMILRIKMKISAIPTVERPQDKWDYLKEHITEMRDADGELNQKDTCKFILELMGVIEREGEKE